MSITTGRTEEEPPTGTIAGDGLTSGGESLVGTFGQVANDHCVNCGSALAPDQRYCVECGTRRGKPRFTLPAGTQIELVDAGAPAATRRPRWSSSTTLLAGIATLLLALGVGVLIGRSSSSTPKNGGIHVVVNGGGASSGAATSTPSSTARSSTSGRSSSSTKSKHTKTGSNPAATKANTPPPSSGVSSNVTKTPTVKPGGACTAGTPGCQGGKETGNFFGSG